jgi:transcriptional regulator with XRE-family HTH domain
MHQEAQNQVPARLRELREACGVSLEALAARLGLPQAACAGYEDGTVDIPIGVLYKITGILNVDLTELLTGNSPKLDTYCVVRQGQGLAVDRYPGYQFTSLAFNFQHRNMEPLLVDLQAGGKAAGLVTHTGQEFNFVLEGTVKLTLGKKELLLQPGDACYFDPRIPHGQAAATGRARFLTVILETVAGE